MSGIRFGIPCWDPKISVRYRTCPRQDLGDLFLKWSAKDKQGPSCGLLSGTSIQKNSGLSADAHIIETADLLSVTSGGLEASQCQGNPIDVPAHCQEKPQQSALQRFMAAFCDRLVRPTGP